VQVKPKVHSSYTSGGLVTSSVTVVSAITVSNVQLAVLDSDSGIPDFSAVLDFEKQEKTSLSANHLQKLRLSFELTSPSGSSFKPQQIFLKLVHETHVEHLYLVKSSGKGFELTLDFLGLVEKLQYLSGTYSVVLIVGDETMENSFVWTLASLDLDLPEAPEGTAPPPTVPVEVNARFAPKPEIAHIFRQPEKRPPILLSNVFLGLALLPLIGFFVGLRYLGANIKLFPTTGLLGVAAFSFHGAIASILLLYFLFWLKLDLFTTLKVLGFLVLLTLLPGHSVLSYLADLSTKQKTS
jgi:oligosaccharyltransferase complex subunit delta (ribophorin II)